jgi:hypothetical protein
MLFQRPKQMEVRQVSARIAGLEDCSVWLGYPYQMLPPTEKPNAGLTQNL